MKYLLSVCLILFFTPYVVPQQLITEPIHWALFIPLAILLPYGFTKSLLSLISQQHIELPASCTNKKWLNKPLYPILQPVCFLVLFSFYVIFSTQTLTSFVGIKSMAIADVMREGDIKESLFQTLSHEDPEAREYAAKHLFQTFGEALYYKNNSNKIVLYQASEEDELAYKSWLKSLNNLKNISISVRDNLQRSLWMSISLFASFIVIFLFTCVYELRQVNPPKVPSSYA